MSALHSCSLQRSKTWFASALRHLTNSQHADAQAPWEVRRTLKDNLGFVKSKVSDCRYTAGSSAATPEPLGRLGRTPSVGLSVSRRRAKRLQPQLHRSAVQQSFMLCILALLPSPTTQPPRTTRLKYISGSNGYEDNGEHERPKSNNRR
jgi:hypothetical protein